MERRVSLSNSVDKLRLSGSFTFTFVLVHVIQYMMWLRKFASEWKNIQVYVLVIGAAQPGSNSPTSFSKEEGNYFIFMPFAHCLQRLFEQHPHLRLGCFPHFQMYVLALAIPNYRHQHQEDYHRLTWSIPESELSSFDGAEERQQTRLPKLPWRIQQ